MSLERKDELSGSSLKGFPLCATFGSQLHLRTSPSFAINGRRTRGRDVLSWARDRRETREKRPTGLCEGVWPYLKMEPGSQKGPEDYEVETLMKSGRSALSGVLGALTWRYLRRPQSRARILGFGGSFGGRCALLVFFTFRLRRSLPAADIRQTQVNTRHKLTPCAPAPPLAPPGPAIRDSHQNMP